MASPSVLLAFLCGGLIAGGLRNPWAWTAVSAGIWALAIRSSARLSWKPLLPWVPWLAWAAVSALASSQPWKSLYPFSRWAGILAYFGLVRSLWGEREKKLWFRGLCASSLLLGVASLWTGLQELLAHGSGEAMHGLIPPYYNYTVFVEAAAIAAIMAALGHPAGPRGRPRGLLWGLLVFLLALLVLARARAGIIAVLGAGFISVLRQGQARRLWILALVLALGGAGMTAAMMRFRGGSLAHMLKPDKAEAAKRPQIWRAALGAARDHPFLGEGPGNFEAGFLRHNFPSHYRVTQYQFTSAYAHSEVLQSAAETGWPGLGLLLLALILSLGIMRPAASSYAQEAALCAAAAMGAQCLVDNMLHVPALAMLLFSAIACAQERASEIPRGAAPVANAIPEGAGDGALRGTARWGPWLGFAGLMLALTAWMPGFLVRAYAERSRGEEDPARKLELARQAASLYPADFSLREDLARAWLSFTPPRRDKAFEELEAASRLNPTNALYYVMRAEMLRDQGKWIEVLPLAERAAGLEPNFLQARLLRAEAWARGGDKALARRELSEVLRRRSELEKARLYTGDRSMYTGYDFMVGSFDSKRFEQVERLAR